MFARSTIKAPTAWRDYGMQWNRLPVLAYPARHGWALWEAIKERAWYIINDRQWKAVNYEKFETGLPNELKTLALPFNLTADCKKAERVMHDAIMWLLPNFYNYRLSGTPPWTLQMALAEIGDDELITPKPYYLSADWLWQAYKFVNLMKVPQFFLSICLIDTAMPDYEDESIYQVDKLYFEKRVPYYMAAVHVEKETGGFHGAIAGQSGLPDAIWYNKLYRQNKTEQEQTSALFDIVTRLFRQFQYAHIPRWLQIIFTIYSTIQIALDESLMTVTVNLLQQLKETYDIEPFIMLWKVISRNWLYPMARELPLSNNFKFVANVQELPVL